MTIDWSKAPEGTDYALVGGRGAPHWHKGLHTHRYYSGAWLETGETMPLESVPVHHPGWQVELNPEKTLLGTLVCELECWPENWGDFCTWRVTSRGPGAYFSETRPYCAPGKDSWQGVGSLKRVLIAAPLDNVLVYRQQWLEARAALKVKAEVIAELEDFNSKPDAVMIIPKEPEPQSEYIDWHSAPVTATHYSPARPGFLAAFWRVDPAYNSRLMKHECWSITEPGKLNHFPNASIIVETWNALIERPALMVWDGEGLPPVESIVEYTGRDHGFMPGAKVRIIYHFRAAAAEVAAFICSRNGGNHVAQAIASMFLPVGTLENRKALERDRAINEMVAAGSGGYGTDPRDVCANLYDANYRKQVAP
ncbi:hypothetical protein [Agrobacterium tumefaciens]|uniref:hypothetical protein n=1 Tax=Agrobacterium tumefaciens TaxID=358 RepID=UPI0015732CE8|nr:hypothetical protein [Agrobacterium tumefaciens]